jgi:hypothetical protein
MELYVVLGLATVIGVFTAYLFLCGVAFGWSERKRDRNNRKGKR